MNIAIYVVLAFAFVLFAVFAGPLWTVAALLLVMLFFAAIRFTKWTWNKEQ